VWSLNSAQMDKKPMCFRAHYYFGPRITSGGSGFPTGAAFVFGYLTELSMITAQIMRPTRARTTMIPKSRAFCLVM